MEEERKQSEKSVFFLLLSSSFFFVSYFFVSLSEISCSFYISAEVVIQSIYVRSSGIVTVALEDSVLLQRVYTFQVL